MKVSLEKEGINIIKVGVEVESEKAMKAYEVACRQVSHRLNIPGFRRGKAPRNIVERAVGVDYLKREALGNLVPEVLGRVITDERLDIIQEPQVDSYEFELGEPLKLKASIEVRPEVKLGAYKGLKVTVEETKLPADAMEKALASVAESRAVLETVPARPVKMGDTAILDFECQIDGKTIEGGKATGMHLEVKEDNFLPGFCEQLVGKEPGNAFDITSKFPEDYRNAELAGKDAVFKVELKEIRNRVMPEMNDELAKALGLESLDKLKEILQERLNEEVKDENDGRTQKAVVEAVVAAAEVTIPDSMIERETNLLLSQLKRYAENSGQSWEDFVNNPKYPEIYKEKKDEANTRVLTSLVLGAVVRDAELQVSEEESKPFLAELISRYNIPVERIRQDEEVRRAFEAISRQAMEEALTRKVVDLLVSESEINFVAETKEKKST